MSDHSAGRLWCALLALALCGGRAVMSESECVNADWGEVGRNDGLEGKRAEELVRYQDACLQYGVTPNGDAYALARLSGRILPVAGLDALSGETPSILA